MIPEKIVQEEMRLKKTLPEWIDAVELLDHRSLERLRLSRVPAAAAGSIGLLEDVLRRVIGHQVAVAS